MEYAALILEQVRRRIELSDESFVEHHDPAIFDTCEIFLFTKIQAEVRQHSNVDRIEESRSIEVHTGSPVVIHDRVESMCDRHDRALFELGPNGLLDEFICLQIDSGCCFIQNEHEGFAEQ